LRLFIGKWAVSTADAFAYAAKQDINLIKDYPTKATSVKHIFLATRNGLILAS